MDKAQNSTMRKIACLFPGIGYTCDKPLLYYSAKMLKAANWEINLLHYGGFPDGVKGNRGKMRQCAVMAGEQAEEALRKIRWNEYDEILFIGKSVGTVVCAAYARQHRLVCRQILFTPVNETFDFASGDSIAFHGTADPWAETETIRKRCRQLNIPLYETENANHSLETGDTDADIRELLKVMNTVRKFALSDNKPKKQV